MNVQPRSVVAAMLCATTLVLPSNGMASDDLFTIPEKIGATVGEVANGILPPVMVNLAKETAIICAYGGGFAAGVAGGCATAFPIIACAPVLQDLPGDALAPLFMPGFILGFPFGAGVGGGVGVALFCTGYTLYDMGEPLYVGVRESFAALTGEDPLPLGNGTALWMNDTLFTHRTAPSVAKQTAVDFSLDPRLQYGGADVDVLGLRLGIFSAENRNVYGFDFCTLLGRSLGDEYALQAGLFNLVDGSTGGLQAGLSNVSLDALYGIQTAGFANVAGGDTPSYGIQAAGLVNRAGDIYGAQVGCLNAADYMAGLQVGVANVGFDRSGPKAGDVHGVQVGVVNACNSGAGLQVGLWNNARTFAGVQIGLVNVIEDHDLPFLPIINAGF